MKRHRKTRQEKIIADLHRKLQVQKTEVNFSTQYTFNKPIKEAKTTTISSVNIAITKTIHPYLLPDLIKTLILTGGILLAEFLLFFILKRHLIVIPNMSF